MSHPSHPPFTSSSSTISLGASGSNTPEGNSSSNGTPSTAVQQPQQPPETPQPYHITHGATVYQQMSSRTNSQPQLFSTTGFDIVGILARVAKRPNPTVFIGPVDFSCAFLVADATVDDAPILYASPALAKMTGYSVDEFLNRSCRFLQWPDGGRTRESHRDNTGARNELRNAITTFTECQVKVTNYRKNGEMFPNLLTIVPIPDGDDWDIIRYWVGFQVDLSTHDYFQRPQRPKHVAPIDPEAPISNRLWEMIPPAESPEALRYNLFEFLEENLDDFVLAVSSNGIINYAAGRVREALGWSARELEDQSLSQFVHPADIDHVLNELASFRFLAPPPRTSSAADIAAHYVKQNRPIQLLYRARIKRPDGILDFPANLSTAPSSSRPRARPVRHRRSRSNVYRPYPPNPHLPSGSRPIPPSSIPRSAPASRTTFDFASSLSPSPPIDDESTAAYEWVESTGRQHIKREGEQVIILSTRVLSLPPPLTYDQVDDVRGFASPLIGTTAASAGGCWARVSLDTGIVLSTSSSPLSLGRPSTLQPTTSSEHLPNPSSRRAPPDRDLRPPPNPRNNSNDSFLGPSARAVPNAFISSLLGAKDAPNFVGSRLQDWVTSDFADEVQTVLADIRKGTVRRFGSWSKPKQTTAMMSPPLPGTGTANEMVRNGNANGNANGAGFDIPKGNGSEHSGRDEMTVVNKFGKPVILTFFPPEPLALGEGTSTTNGSTNGNGHGHANGGVPFAPGAGQPRGPGANLATSSSSTAASTSRGRGPIPIHTPYTNGQDGVPVPVPVAYDTRTAGPAPPPPPPVHIPPPASMPASSTNGDGTESGVLLPESMIVWLSSPIQSLPPQGMLSATGAPQTNQAYLYDPFGAMSLGSPQLRTNIREPASTSPRVSNGNVASGSAANNKNGAALQQPPLPGGLPHLSQTPRHRDREQQLAIGIGTMPPPPPAPPPAPLSSSLPPLMLGPPPLPSANIFESFSSFASEGNNGHPRWEDQIEALRAQNIRMQQEIDELVALRQAQAQTQAQAQAYAQSLNDASTSMHPGQAPQPPY